MAHRPCRWCHWYRPGWCEHHEMSSADNATCNDWQARTARHGRLPSDASESTTRGPIHYG